jgi:hypothetical protein
MGEAASSGAGRRANLVRYVGVFAPNARLRPSVVPVPRLCPSRAQRQRRVPTPAARAAKAPTPHPLGRDHP